MITILVIVLSLTTFSIYQATTSLKSSNINDAGTSQLPTMPNGNSNNSTNEPPAKPDSDTAQDNLETPPEMPSGNNQENQNGPGANNNMNQMSSNTKNASLSIIYYVIFTAEALTIALILTYLLSNV